MYKKPLIVFEGIEGSGKTLHSKFLANYLNKKNKIYQVKRARWQYKFRENKKTYFKQ